MARTAHQVSFSTTLENARISDMLGGMKDFSKKLMWAVVILMGISVLYSGIAGALRREKEIALSDVVAKINAGEVASVDVADMTLDVKLKNGDTLTAQKETETGLTETLRNYGVSPDRLKDVQIAVKTGGGMSFFLGILIPILAPVLLIAFFIWFSGRQIQRGSVQAFTFGQSRARLISPESEQQKTTFKDVAGVKEAKEELKEVVDFLKNPKKYLDIGAKIPKGVLLIGAPGTGKSLLAKAVSGEAGVPFFHMSASEFIEMFVGVGASRVRDTFRMAKKVAPAIVFIDELDAVGRIRGAGIGGGHDEREQTLNQLLVEMDGMETSDKVLIFSATNRPDVLDPALLRPGRFDRRVVLDLPDINDREEILKIHMRNKPAPAGMDLRLIAERTPGFSGADLANLVNEAAILAARNDRKQVERADLVASIEKVLLGPERKSHLLSHEEKRVSAYHEAGHALVAASLPHADPVHKVSIVSRGRAAGYTLKLPSEDRHLYTRSHFLDELASALGGFAAEKLVFNELTTGPHDDLKKATDLARNLVTRFGMSDAVGPLALSEPEGAVFLGHEFPSGRGYSEETARVVDAEVKRIMDEASARARTILTERRAILDAVAAVLIEKETIERDEFEKIVGSADNGFRQAGA
jgi:cell division protease FtsH